MRNILENEVIFDICDRLMSINNQNIEFLIDKF